MMTIQKLLYDIRDRLTPSLGEFALPEAEAIIQQSLNITRTQLYTDTSTNVSDDDISRINTIIKRRTDGEPLPYILGKTYFYDREFFVTTDVLIPRPDTEILVETILKSEESDRISFVDIGTGSGIIPAILKKHRPQWFGVAVDISPRALRVAARNLRGDRHDNIMRTAGEHSSPLRDDDHNDIILICGDMLSAVKAEKQFDVIVSNPPYISSAQMETLDRSVSSYEPHTALHGGNDGLDYYRLISNDAKMYLKDGGRLYLEIGFDQGESVPNIFLNDVWSDVNVVKDLGGRDRVVIVRS